ncbi:MAG: dephospho-CoA kinase [Solirubrobacteraceae bacterium]|nr:dephospho-CoA kinase [Solirubrobacteraceae bacterium]
MTSPDPTRLVTAAVPFVGLTGGLAAGKSTALGILAELGVPVLSTDAVVHELYLGEELRRIVVDRWGREVAPDGVVDRQAIAGVVFGDPDERRWLEEQIWPRVGERVWAFRQDAQQRDPAPPAAVVETPLLFEAGMADAYDATIAVIAPEALRAERAAARGHAAVDERNSRHLTQQEKAERATYVVVNDGSLRDLRGRLGSILDDLRNPVR